ncbi:unnamed protein product [Adineta ricciae]|uniref:Uncharacterized protein n=1 Tax=Adineta ricciae TaxID=249248 RepID=A0A813RCN5_ADIRI|nr:unnamed protein product [Adineta ricciae]CAF1186099.1 unnamed protein product [Adineta ricciae]
MEGSVEWNESLFGCFDNCGICLCGWCCTPCLFGRNAEKIDDSNCCLWCCIYMCLTDCAICWYPHYMKRKLLRQKYDLREDPHCGDLFATICCGPCALCQEARFLKRQDEQPNDSMHLVPNTRQPGRNY